MLRVEELLDVVQADGYAVAHGVEDPEGVHGTADPRVVTTGVYARPICFGDDYHAVRSTEHIPQEPELDQQCTELTRMADGTPVYVHARLRDRDFYVTPGNTRIEVAKSSARSEEDMLRVLGSLQPRDPQDVGSRSYGTPRLDHLIDGLF